MARVTLIEATPWSSADGSAQTVRLAGGGRAGRPYSGYRGATDWKSGVADVPLFSTSLGFDDSGFTGGAVPQTGSVRFFPALASTLDALAALNWRDAPVTIYSGDDKDGPPAVWTTELVGTVAASSALDGALTLTIADLANKLDVKLLTGRFAGTGGIEGVSQAEGRVKRRTWGQVSNVEGLILDKANSIYEFGDPAFPLFAFDAVRDKGRAGTAGTPVAWQGSIAATFAALQAAAVPSGGYVAAPSIACVKWWTQPAGPLTADLRGEVGTGYVNGPGGIAARIVSAVGGPLFVAGTATAADTTRPYVVGLHVESDSETTANALDRLLLPLSLVWTLRSDGTIEILPVNLDAPVETITAVEVDRIETFKPTKSRRIGYLKNHRQQSDAEISPAATSSDSAVYADGTPIDDLRPAESGANVTESRTSAAIAGQGTLATANSAQWSTQVVGAGKPENNATVGGAFGTNLLETIGGSVATLANFKTSSGTAAAIAGQGALATLAKVAFGSTIEESAGGAVATLSAFKTALGTASSVLGQGDLATQNTAAWLTQITGTGKPENNATVGAVAGTNLLETAGGATLALAAIKTILGTAAGFTGQGALATKNVAAAADISVGSLSAIAADLGIITAGLLRSATSSTQLDLNNNRLLFNNGSVMLVSGVGFGSSSQFILWFGPTQANLNTCTEANATFYLKTNGSAYFGGALSAGTLTTKASTSSTSATAEIETAVFGSNGGTITVTLGYNYSASRRIDYLPSQGSSWDTEKATISPTPTDPDGDFVFRSNGNDSAAASIVLYRSINGGSYVAVATLSPLGIWDWDGERPNGSDPGYSNFHNTNGGSLTYTDPATVAQNRQYKAVITSRSPRLSTNIAQNVSIIAVEQ